jgi:hypothetical protein
MFNKCRWISARRVLACALAIGSTTAMILACYGPALFRDRQFGYRDAGHYYYPLYQRVQREWDAGRWPLWEPEENAGMPLLGNPTAAVLYPGKLIYALLPYSWAARVYIVAHTALAFAAMIVLMRSWGAGAVAATLAALSYAFGAPILFQSCNVIFLVGAAWLPLGFHAADRWARLGSRWGLLELAVVLAMQALGGDPESAYLLGWAAGGYAAGIAWHRGRKARAAYPEGARGASPLDRGRWAVPWLVAAVAAWFAATVALGTWLPRLRPPGPAGHPAPLPWMASMPMVIGFAWALGAAGFLLYWRRRGRRFALGVAWSGLALAALLAMAASAAQLLPVMEFTRLTQRAELNEWHDVYPFSLEPFRLVEMVWPNVFGSQFGEQTAWSNALPLPGTRPLLWVPSLYLGGFTLLLALGALSLRCGPPWRIWLSAVAMASLAGSLGQYSSPIWATRALAAATGSPALRDLAGHLGPLDPPDVVLIRADGRLRDGDGGFYWWMTQVLPGFRQFRFPSKLLVFTAMACSALAGLGWDALSNGRRRGVVILLLSFLAASLALMACAYRERPAILAAFRAVNLNAIFGPFDPPGGFAAIVASLAQASTVFGLGLVAVGLVRSRPGWAGALAIAATTADLALANARYVVTVPQAILDARPEVLEVIEAAERNDPSPGPYRVHRMPAWAPLDWWVTPSADRASELAAWEVATIQSKFGITWGIEYTESPGVGELSPYSATFRGFHCPIRDPEAARRMRLALNQPIVYFPRRSFDLWNTRYFVVPIYPSDWNDEQRAVASFVYGSERLYPPAERFRGPDGDAEYKRWTGYRDFQVLRNDQAYPRAWVVHGARPIPTIRGTSREDRRRCLDEMTYGHDLWRESGLRVFDPRAVGWIDVGTMRELARYLPGGAARPYETVKVTYPDPQRVELVATLESPGLVVLSDVYYPGWELTIDGRPAPIYKVNLIMRGAAVDAGTHRLVYSYRPRSFLIGRIISLVGLAALVLLAAICAVRPVDEGVAGIGLSPRQPSVDSGHAGGGGDQAGTSESDV